MRRLEKGVSVFCRCGIQRRSTASGASDLSDLSLNKTDRANKEWTPAAMSVVGIEKALAVDGEAAEPRVRERTGVWQQSRASAGA